MSRMLSKMNLISVVQQLPKEDIETIQGYVEMIEKENQELKLELSGYRQAILNNKEMLGLKEQNEKLKKKYENAVADYETTMAEKNKLKKQVENTIEELELVRCDLHNRTSERDGAEKQNDLYKKQQQEFIKYLEDYLKLFDNKDIYEEGSYDTIEEILSKYKEIIGVSDENNL